jgi:cytochrome bd-type quinol oxidase subunit 2
VASGGGNQQTPPGGANNGAANNTGSGNSQNSQPTQGSCDAGFVSVNGLCIPKNQFTCGADGLACQTTAGSLLIQVIKILLTISGVIAVLFIVIGGFWYITANGNEEQSKKGRKAITAAIIGMVIIILAYAIITIVTKTLTTGI